MHARRRHLCLRSASAFLLVAAAAVAGSGTAQAATHVWGPAIEVPGMSTSSFPWVTALSCASTGYCSVGGSSDSSATVAWVAEEVNGTWQTAKPVPNVVTLNSGGGSHGTAGLGAISCPSAGNCTAAGHYLDSTSGIQSWVADEVNGTWHNAKETPGTATLNAGGAADIGGPSALSCASAGNCSAGGFYWDSQHVEHAFVVNEVRGTWQTAKQVPGMAALGTGGQVTSVSCATAGNCSAVGTYTDANNHGQTFAVNEGGGVWGIAHAIPNVRTLNKGGGASVEAVSCASAGNCAASGSYSDASHLSQPFVVNEVGGTWQSASQVPGMSTLNKGSGADYYSSISCRSAGNCSTGGSYHDAAGHSQAFVANEVSGTWSAAREVPGTATLNKGNGFAATVSCSSAGNCSVGGSYTDLSGTSQVFVADETAGTWRTAKEIPGTAALNTGVPMPTYYAGANVSGLSCVATGACAAAGEYWDSSNNRHVFVVNRT
jgi:hypothetical protein